MTKKSTIIVLLILVLAVYSLAKQTASKSLNLTVTSSPSGNSVLLKWTASTTPGATYNVYRFDSNVDSVYVIKASGLTTLTYTDTVVTSKHMNFYTVTAVVNGMESLKSNEVSIKIP